MAISLKPLEQQVVVITGASSGIGLATARAAAARGARVVLAARNGEALARIERDIDPGGGRVTHVVADVGRCEDVQRIADVALERFGGLDTWVNNAGVGIYGQLDKISEADARRLFDTNFWGVVFGSQVALPHLERTGGALINIGSVVSDMAMTTQGMYAASKHAVKGFTDALRLELKERGAPVSVTLIKPGTINTPYVDHAANYTGAEPSLPPPVYSPEEVADAILFAAEHPKRDIFVGSAAKALSVANRIAPGVVEHTGGVMSDQQRGDRPAAPTAGSLHEPGEDGHVHGPFEGHVMRTSAYTRASMHPWTTALVFGAIAATTLALMTGEAARNRLPHP